MMNDDSTSFHQAFQSMRVLIVDILSIGKESLHMDSFADDILNLVTPTSSFDISRKGPLTDTPMLNAAFGCRRIISIMTRHVPTAAPIGLTGNLTKVAAASTGIIRTIQIDTNVMRTMIVLPTRTIPSSRIPRQGHAWQRTRLQGSSVNIQM